MKTEMLLNLTTIFTEHKYVDDMSICIVVKVSDARACGWQL